MLFFYFLVLFHGCYLHISVFVNTHVTMLQYSHCRNRLIKKKVEGKKKIKKIVTPTRFERVHLYDSRT